MTPVAETGETVGAALARARGALQVAGIDTAALDARLLVAASLGASIEQVIAWPERTLAPEAAARLEGFLRRRAAREPMAYILGRREFWSLDFMVTSATLTPRPDSETLVAAVLDEIGDRAASLDVVDFGTGTGCLLLALLSEMPNSRGLGIDLASAALNVARANAAQLGLATRARFVQGEWGRSLAGAFDLVISNPPYIATGELAGLAPELHHEPRLALDGGTDGLDAYRRLIPDALRLLRPGGLLALEIGVGQVPAVSAILVSSELSLLGVRRDLAGIERCLLARRGAG